MPGKWHNRMEEYFPEEMREVKFFCSSKKTENICRRADILLNDKRTCEIQHSHISSYEIQKRFEHWNKFGKEIIWLVDGNTDDVKVEKLTKGTYLIEFRSYWKYKSFKNKYDFILLDINNDIYKIPLNEVKCHMVEVKEFKKIDEVINILKTKPENIWNMWIDENSVNSKLTIHQKGAGNGKTYGIWESICKNNDKETYIIVTKQHTAKEVIYRELIDQAYRKEEHILENISDKSEENTDKHYVIKYKHIISGKECIVIIGTIDSFCFNLTNCENNTDDFFKNLLETISNKGCSKLNEGFMKFASQYIKLNKKAELWIDEVQDLPITYLNAMTKLILETNIDVNVVGDKLQSLEFENNFLTELSDGLPNIQTVPLKPENNNRRIKVNGMCDEINNLINFDELPIITTSNNLIDKGKPIETIKTPKIYGGDTDTDKINNYIDTIIDKVNEEVNLYSYKPEDFLFIFPIMKRNNLATELEARLQSYWIDKFKKEDYLEKLIDDNYWSNYDHSKYTKYAVLHKHQDGQVINTKDSIKSSRIMSIRSSKGDGREVVFILNCTEESLKIVSNGKINLLYESHLHVALTRAKSKIYFGLTKNNDDIHKRFGKCGHIEYIPSVSDKLKPSNLLIHINKNKVIELIKDIVDPLEEDKTQLGEIVDWKYHCIKRELYHQYFIFSLLNNEDIHTNFEKSQLKTIIRGIQRLKIKEMHINDFYPYLRELKGDITCLPVCNMEKNTNYCKEYHDKIENTMGKINNTFIKGLYKLNPYEAVILSYMIQLFHSKHYSEMSPKDLYDITDFFETEYITKEQQLLENTEHIKSVTNKVLDEIQDTFNEKITWNIHHYVKYSGNNDEFNIANSYPLISYSDNHIFHFVLKTDYNYLNYWDTLIEILIERFIITEAKGNDREENNNTRYDSKPIITYLLILNTNSYEKFIWSLDDSIYKKIKEYIVSAIISYYTPYHKEYYNYLKYVSEYINPESSPYQYIIDKLKDDKKQPKYVLDYFNELNDYYETDDGIESEKKFLNKLSIKLNKRCRNYLNI